MLLLYGCTSKGCGTAQGSWRAFSCTLTSPSVDPTPETATCTESGAPSAGGHTPVNSSASCHGHDGGCNAVDSEVTSQTDDRPTVDLNPADMYNSASVSGAPAFGFDCDEFDDVSGDIETTSRGAFDFSDLDAALDKAASSTSGTSAAVAAGKRGGPSIASTTRKGIVGDSGEKDTVPEELIPTCVAVQSSADGRDPPTLPEFYLYAEPEPIGRKDDKV